jgi:Mn2+/Fe2+ NRAMP family transporter
MMNEEGKKRDQSEKVTMEEPEELKKLELPNMNVWGMLRHFGPGLILMMTGIGTSHLVTAPTAGGRFAYALLWCLPVAYIFKYYGFEMAFRFTNATGRSIMDAYSTAWKKWPLWYIMIVTLIQCAIGQAGRMVATAAVLYYGFTVSAGVPVPLWVWGALLGALACSTILTGKYKAVEISTKILAGLLLISALGVYFVRLAPLSALGHYFMFEIPQGSWLIIAAFLGLLPTGIDVSLQASEWGKAKRVGMGKIREALEKMELAKSYSPFGGKAEDLRVDASKLPAHVQEYVRRWFRIGLWDFRVGHIVSFLLASVFILLAAVWLYPSAVEGRGVMGEIARIFTESVGPWMMSIFLLGAFAATFSTMFNYFDGWPRVIGACCRNLFKRTAQLPGIAREDITRRSKGAWYSEFNIYRITMMYSLIASVAIIAGLPRPVWLVLVASALAFFIAPVVFALNLYYCFKVIPREDKYFYPSLFAKWFGWGSLAVFTGLTVLLFLARVLGIPLFGG